MLKKYMKITYEHLNIFNFNGIMKSIKSESLKEAYLWQKNF